MRNEIVRHQADDFLCVSKRDHSGLVSKQPRIKSQFRIMQIIPKIWGDRHTGVRTGSR